MENLKTSDNYSLVLRIIKEIPKGLNSRLRIIDKNAISIVNELSDRLEMNKTETILFSAIIYSQMTQKTCETARIAEIINTPIEFIYKNQTVLDKMNFKGIIEINFENQSIESYYINRAIRNSFFAENNKPKTQKKNYSFIEIIEFATEKFGPNMMTIDDKEQIKLYKEKLNSILTWNKHLPEINSLNKIKLNFPEKIILLITIGNNIIQKGSVNLGCSLDNVSDDTSEAYILFQSLTKKVSKLITGAFIELSNEENESLLTYNLGPKGLEYIKYLDKSNSPLVLPKSELLTAHYPAKTANNSLFFDDAANKDYDRISMLLIEKNFKKFTGKNGITKGLNFLFYGLPGTGKTESAMQLAKSSGRIVLQTNLSTIRDKWIGSSEKNAQKIFDDYARIALSCKLKPILLLNEADAILGSRLDVTQSADQTNNTMQNIFLESLENFDGILIATTNLQNNLDKAFDRRFLVKMNFQLPSKQKRLEISASKITDIPLIMHEIISEFEFSGGQLDNISKKIKMFEMLDGEKVNIETVRTICSEEQVIKQSNKSIIGFK